MDFYSHTHTHAHRQANIHKSAKKPIRVPAVCIFGNGVLLVSIRKDRISQLLVVERGEQQASQQKTDTHTQGNLFWTENCTANYQQISVWNYKYGHQTNSIS